MKCLMPLTQRKVIAEAIEGRYAVEWGVGGTTAWLFANSKPMQLTSIEHDGGWASKVSASIRGPVAWYLHTVACSPGQNATIGEEDADDDDCYISSGVSCRADVYLIDGVVRAKCLRALVATGRPMTVFIHDTQRDWYDDAIAEAVAAGFERTDYPEGDDYPGCLLTKLTKER